MFGWWNTYVVGSVKAVFWVLYFEGPSLGGYAFWSGKPAEDICQELTGVSASHWMQHMDVCEAKLETNFYAFYVGAITVLVALFLWKFVSLLLWHVFFVRPMLQAIVARVSPRLSQLLADKQNVNA